MAEKVREKMKNYEFIRLFLSIKFILQMATNMEERRLWIGNLDTRITE